VMQEVAQLKHERLVFVGHAEMLRVRRTLRACPGSRTFAYCRGPERQAYNRAASEPAVPRPNTKIRC
jgi:hypothetical protein